MDCKTTSTKLRTRTTGAPAAHRSSGPKPSGKAGFTLVEFLITVAVASVVLGQTCTLWLFSSRALAAQMSYAGMDQRSMHTLDTLSQEIRQCRALTNFTTTRVTFLDHDNKALTFAFEKGALIRLKSGSAPKILLQDCVAGEFAMFQRSPIAGGFDYFAVKDPALCKAIEVRWACSRNPAATLPLTTGSMQSARIVMRMK
jgi:prepilin-type N-terminal cleavage/methylation domain-containing protein